MSKVRVGIVGVGNCASAFVQGVEFYTVPAYPHVRLQAVGRTAGTAMALVPAQSEAEYHLREGPGLGEAAGITTPAAAASPAPSLVGWEVRVTPSAQGQAAVSAVTAVTDEQGIAFLDGLPVAALETARVEVRPPPAPPPAEL